MRVKWPLRKFPQVTIKKSTRTLCASIMPHCVNLRAIQLTHKKNYLHIMRFDLTSSIK